MSWVANVLLSVSMEDRQMVEKFSQWLDNDAPWNGPTVPPGATGVGSLRPLSGRDVAWGGYKNPECHVSGGVLNHADLDAVVSRFGELSWQSPGSAQLFIKEQEQSYFRVWMIRDGRPMQYAPEPMPGDDGSY